MFSPGKMESYFIESLSRLKHQIGLHYRLNWANPKLNYLCAILVNSYTITETIICADVSSQIIIQFSNCLHHSLVCK